MNDISQDFSGNLTRSIEMQLVTTVVKPARISAEELHKYVLGLIGVLMLFAITYPIAMHRVAQEEKFAPYKFYLKSLTLEYKPIKPQANSRS
ncbi:hypothetical protein [Chamaesiphon sp. VAR_48_metabat_135_sub]|uniref:hypothetical protein n=1 Tax=Chamaesiphon sp. VAR_48_metabat_135_sub TaxID=2964699 RepID=UPI00286B0E1A|nr:hypothetical protein [Chamaesiphon sp. VAR_48_metabat_135_sub]